MDHFAANEMLAYIGPGGGFAIVASTMTVLVTFFTAIFVLISYPFVFLYRMIRYRATRKRRMTKRVVIMGLDGLDPALMEEMIAAGELPTFAAMKWRSTLETVPPPLSPVAWSSFATGSMPGSHRVFDFVHCNPRNYMPFLSSYEVSQGHAGIHLGPIKVPFTGGSPLKKLWKSDHFWDILGRHGVFNTVLRVPVTFPPNISRGHLLSGMCVPDVLGSQGISTLFTTQPAAIEDENEGRAVRITLGSNGTTKLPLAGPQLKDGKASVIEVGFKLGANGTSATINVAGKEFSLTQGKHTEWIPIEFPGTGVNGIVRFFLNEVKPHLIVYASPIHIDPSKPATPVSHPSSFSVFMSKLMGRFATIGICEDTAAYENGAINGAGMLEQCYLAHAEREKQFFHALDAQCDGLLVCVFDTPDRVQHMFWREHEAGDRTIRDMYRKMDDLLKRTLTHIDKKTTFFAMSDHGFNAFRRTVHINSWLRERGYVVPKKDIPAEGEGSDPMWLKGVDMTQTVAFGFGLTGIHLNKKSFFAKGILNEAQVAKVKAGLIKELEELTDPATGEKVVTKAQDATEVYSKGPYSEAAPDIIIGWKPGYRVSWESAKGQTLGPIFSDNKRFWSGDHCFYPPQVPGMLLSNIVLNNKKPRIIDMAPTAMRLLGVTAPGHMDGSCLVGPAGKSAEPSTAATKSAPEPAVARQGAGAHAG